MEAFESVRTVLAVRKYAQGVVPPETTRRILEAGRLTGSSMNRQPWHFVLVDSRETLRDLGRLAPTGPYIAQGGMAIAVAIDKNEYAVYDASRAIQSMILAAWSDGIASNWVGFFGLEEAKALLGIPEHMNLFAIIAFGYAAVLAMQGKKNRRALSEVAHYGRFGNPFNTYYSGEDSYCPPNNSMEPTRPAGVSHFMRY